MKTKPRRFRTETLQSACWILPLLVALSTPPNIRADGCFVAPKFVWDKHKDINEPTQKAIIAYDSGREDLILQVKYDGPVEEFGWLIPVPGLPTVQKGSMQCFYELSRYTQKLWGPWTPAGKEERPSPASGKGARDKSTEEVEVVEIKTVGDYEVAVLSAKESDALKSWLDANGFSLPPTKSAILDSYIKQQWYFVAVKIHLGQSDGFRMIGAVPKSPVSKAIIAERLASRELHPLHLSFASERCVFPLKVSSVNGKASEVQVYLLSSEPLLERALFEKKLPGIYSNDMAQVRRNAENFRENRLVTMRQGWGHANLDFPDVEKEVEKIRITPRVAGELPHYVQIATKELPGCGSEIPRLAEGPWWLTKYIWTFQPDEMNDLEFEAATPVFTEKLDSQYGYYAAACLTQLGVHAVPELLSGIQGSNRAVRAAITSAFDSGYADSIRGDWRFRDAAPRMARDPDPEIQRFALMYLGVPPETLLELMHAPDFKVAGLAGENMMQVVSYRAEGKKYIPALQEMLRDTNSATRAAAIEALRAVHAKIPRADLLQFFSYPNLHVVWTAYTKLVEQDEDISNEDARPLLQNSDFSVRIIGLKTLGANEEKSSVKLALPLLNDPEQLVRVRAQDLLEDLTGQNFPTDASVQWSNWWNQNQSTFVINGELIKQRHSERMRQTSEAIRHSDSLPASAQ